MVGHIESEGTLKALKYAYCLESGKKAARMTIPAIRATLSRGLRKALSGFLIDQAAAAASPGIISLQPARTGNDAASPHHVRRIRVSTTAMASREIERAIHSPFRG
jgi:hypothetical protein